VFQEEKPSCYPHSAGGGVKRYSSTYSEILGWRGRSSLPYNVVSGND
jgi:hypothetical protein